MLSDDICYHFVILCFYRKKEIDDIAITLLECFEDNVASKLANNVENLDMGQLSCNNEHNNAVKTLEFEEHSSNDSDLDRVCTSCIGFFCIRIEEGHSCCLALIPFIFVPT